MAEDERAHARRVHDIMCRYWDYVAPPDPRSDPTLISFDNLSALVKEIERLRTIVAERTQQRDAAKARSDRVEVANARAFRELLAVGAADAGEPT